MVLANFSELRPGERLRGIMVDDMYADQPYVVIGPATFDEYADSYLELTGRQLDPAGQEIARLPGVKFYRVTTD